MGVLRGAQPSGESERELVLQHKLQVLQLKLEGHEHPLDTVDWPDVVNFIRRAPPAHKRWLSKARKAGAGKEDEG